MSVYEEFLSANEMYSATFNVAGDGAKPMPPARKVAVVTCMDARLDPAKFLGLEIGDAHVIRNAGGRVSEDALRSLVISERLLGTTEIVVIHHTGLRHADLPERGPCREDPAGPGSRCR
jgi:carbonic anhydrase